VRVLCAILFLFLAGPSWAQVGTIALTFDYWPNDMTNVWLEMNSRGFRGTYYVAPEMIDQAGGPALGDLVLINQIGNEIGIYTNVDMVALMANNRITAFQKLKSLYDGMEAFGFKAVTVAPNARRWNSGLANFSRTRFKGVRVASIPAIQSYPIPDNFYVNGGAAVASLGSATSLQSVKDATDAVIAAGGMIVIVVHKVGPVADALTFPQSDWISLLNYWQGKGSALRVLPFSEALKAP
jgi:hypothetical protein